MKIVFLTAILFSAFLLGCSSSFFSSENHKPLPETFYATVITRDGAGSSINLGGGYFLSCSHVIRDSLGRFDKKIYLTEEFENASKTDSSVKIIDVDTINDLALLKSSELTNKTDIKFIKDPIFERVYWIQPAFYSDEYLFFLISGRVSGYNKKNVFLDKPIFDGASGTGIFDEKGYLVGIAQSTFIYEKNLLFGCLVGPEIICKFLIKNGIKIPKM
ncbi:serine protease [Patescibacteria group bacterium]|nr:serine protease [Patescibacteria group bacterium]